MLIVLGLNPDLNWDKGNSTSYQCISESKAQDAEQRAGHWPDVAMKRSMDVIMSLLEPIQGLMMLQLAIGNQEPGGWTQINTQVRSSIDIHP